MNRERQPSLSLNFLMNIILMMSAFIFPLVTFPYVSRVLLAEGNGKVQMAVSFVAYFTMIAQLGIPTYGVRVCAAVREDKVALSKTVHELTIIQIITTLISYAAFFVCLESIPKLQAERSLYLIVSSAIALNAFGMEWLYRALEEYTYITVRSIAFKVVGIVAMFLLVKSPEHYQIYGGITTFSSFGSYLMNLTQLPKMVDLHPMKGYELKKHVKPILIFFAYACAATVYTNLDSVMLGFMATSADAGYYGVAVKIRTILVSIINALGIVLLPRVSYYFEKGLLDDFWRIASKAFRIVLWMAIPLTSYFTVFAPNVIYFLSGREYVPSIIPTMVILPTLIFIGIGSVTGGLILIPSKRESVVMWATVAGALVNLVLNWIFIPSLRSTGAAIGTLVAEMITVVIHLIVLRKHLSRIFTSLRLTPILIATLLATLSSFWAARLPWGDFGILVFSALIFLGVYLLILLAFRDPFLLEVKKKALSFLKIRSRK